MHAQGADFSASITVRPQPRWHIDLGRQIRRGGVILDNCSKDRWYIRVWYKIIPELHQRITELNEMKLKHTIGQQIGQ